MRKKFRIFSTITAMVLVVLVMCVGIWAATQATVSGTGNLIFTTSGDVQAIVTIKSDDAIIKNPEGEDYLSEWKIAFNGSESSINETISFKELSFSSSKKTYTFNILVENDYDNKDDNKLTSSLATSIGEGANDYEIESSVVGTEAANENSVSYTVTISYKGNYEETVSGTFSFSLKIGNASNSI